MKIQKRGLEDKVKEICQRVKQKRQTDGKSENGIKTRELLRRFNFQITKEFPKTDNKENAREVKKNNKK